MSSNNQNDSGGGCLLFLIDWIFSIIQNRRIRKYNKRKRRFKDTFPVIVDWPKMNPSHKPKGVAGIS